MREQETRSTAMEFAAHMGLDWADEKHAVCLESADGWIQEEFDLEQKPDAIHAWVAQLRQRGLADNV